MKQTFVYVFIGLQLLFHVSCVYLTEHTTAKKTFSTKSYKDLLEIEVKCPYNGVFKNFAVEYDSSQYWFEYICYSSFSEGNENDESVIKSLSTPKTQTFKYAMTDSIESLAKVDFICPVDFALSSFKFTKDSNNYIIVEYTCVGVKSSTQTKANTLTSESQEGDVKTLAGLKGLRCGDTSPDSNSSYPKALKGFKFIISSSKVQYGYSIQQLRKIEDERTAWGSSAKKLRDSNTQQN